VVAREIVLACRVLDTEGLVEAFGHVSARIPGTDRILVSPRTAPALVTPAALVEVDLARGGVRGARSPLELPIHTGVYRRHPGVGAVCRIHGRAASVLSVAGIELRPLHYLGTLLRGRVPVYDDGALITTETQGRALADALRGHTALLLRGNGQVVTGRTVREACIRAIYLEEAARVQLQALLAGRARAYTGRELATYARTWDDPVNVDRAWAYYGHRAGRPPGRVRWNRTAGAGQ
jgi:ribulose-5-phosphate 4-epimerase/fuculose-1-phosphate aldolase